MGHAQGELFGAPAVAPQAALHASHWPDGLTYAPDFLTGEEEAACIQIVRALPLEAAKYKVYTARRRVLSFGGHFDPDDGSLQLSPPQAFQPLIEGLRPLRQRVADWLGVAPTALVHAMVSEYQPGTPLGWHRDAPDFEDIAGVSLGSTALLRFRPHPMFAAQPPTRQDVVRLPVAPRSIYRMHGPARWAWQHSVAPTTELRWSITWRTARARRTGAIHALPVN